MVVTQHYVASEVGEAILSKGGSAYDATIAVAFALLVLPRAGNIGGGFYSPIQLIGRIISKFRLSRKGTLSCIKKHVS